ncbi:MAG: NAD(P)/FAD-dependent oxidoreductase, partial [Lachnospiraceae bacterium]
NYPGIESINGFEFAMRLYRQVINLGGKIIYEKVESIQNDGLIKLIKTGSKDYLAKAVIIATGTRKAVLGLENEKKLTGKGVSYCATCDGAFFKGKDVAVVGGGNTALEDGLFLADYCNKVYMIHRREKFSGEEKYVKELETKKNIECIMETEVTAINGNDCVESIELTEKGSGSKREIHIAGIFIAIGQKPQNTQFGTEVTLDERGYVIAGEDCITGCEGVFAAGDCRTKKIRQLTTAAADGTVAALAASAYASQIKL